MDCLRGGKILRVNLTDGQIRSESARPYTDRFVGGKGMNLKILLDGVPPAAKALDPENLLLFGAGALVGTPFPGACRTDVMAKSPVTGVFGDAGMGGYLGAELKFAGYDSVVIEGKADRPVYLSIRDDRVEIRDASALRGRDTYETPTLVRQDLRDPAAKVVSIGPAGERLVAYASINSGSGNAAARTGLGAVMGSKNLKALAVRGTGGVAVARPREFLEACRKLLQKIRASRFYDDLHEAGLTRLHDREMRVLYELLENPGAGCESICEGDFLKEHLYNRVGCDLGTICRHALEVAEEKERARGVIAAAIAQSAMTIKVLTALPFIILGALRTMSPAFAEPLFHTMEGNIVFMFSISWVILGDIVTKRMISSVLAKGG